jgi:predicted nucleotidyltransferase
MSQQDVRPARIRDAGVRVALDDLERHLRTRYGSRFVRLILFGSRARGDARPDSDVDVAIVLRGPMTNRWAEKEAIIDDTYPILLETGLYIQPWPIELGALEDPSSARNPALIREILHDGVQP